MSNDPASTQTEEEIVSYLRLVNPGDEVAMRWTYAGILHYYILKVENVNPRRGRIYTEEHKNPWAGTAWYSSSGKNAHAPKGQARLCIPTDAVREFARQYPDGRSPFQIPTLKS